MALTPGTRDPSWGHNAREGASGVCSRPGRSGAQEGEGTAGRRDQRRGSGSRQARSQPHLLPRLMIPRPADHTPTLTWLLTSTSLEPSQQGEEPGPGRGSFRNPPGRTPGPGHTGIPAPLPRMGPELLRKGPPVLSASFPSDSPPNELLYIPQDPSATPPPPGSLPDFPGTLQVRSRQAESAGAQLGAGSRSPPGAACFSNTRKRGRRLRGARGGPERRPGLHLGVRGHGEC